MTSDWPRPAEPTGSASSLRRDAEAAVATRRELGPEYDEHVAAGLADRVEELVAYRTAELTHASQSSLSGDQLEATAQRQRFTLAIISLGVGIPVTGITATQVDPGLLGAAIGWAGIVGVNIVAALGFRRHDRHRG